MSVQNISTVNVFEFERREAHLSEEDGQDEPPYTIHGVALGAGDITRGTSGIEKKWPAEELKKAADTLQGTSLVVDHNNSSTGVVGRVTKSGYKDNVGVIYEAELYDEELAEKVRDGLLEVSIRGYHVDVDEMEETEDGVKIVEGIEFDNLSIVPKGASPSNSLEMGEHASLSAEELAAFTEDLEELQEFEASDFVEWDDMHGVIFKIEDDTATIEVMEEIDGKWRAVGEQVNVAVEDLEQWDVDESDIGEPKEAESDDEESEDEESDEETEEDDEVEENKAPENFMFQSEDKAIEVSRQLGLEGATHTMEVEGVTYYMPGETHENFLAAYMETDELSSLPEELNRHLLDRKHPMKDTRDMQGENPDGEESPEDTESEEDEDVPSPPRWEDGMLVQWQVEPQLFGKIVHVDTKRDIVMVEIHQMKNGELAPTGFTISAGFSDIQQFERGAVQSAHGSDEEMAAQRDKVQWGTDDELSRGIVVDRQTSGCFEERLTADNRVCAEDDDPVLLIAVVEQTNGSYKRTGRMVAHNESSVEQTDFSLSAEELQAIHEPEWESAEDKEWNAPDLEDFTDESWEDLSGDERMDIANHFLVSKTGEMPPERFSDLALPVVEPDGTLNLNALANAKARAGQVEGVSSEDEKEINNLIDKLANDNFEDATFGDEEEMESGTPSIAGVQVLTSDDLQQSDKSGESEMDSTTKVINMTELSDELQARLEELEAPVAVEETDLEELREKAEKYDDISEDISELRERTEVLDAVDRELVDELAESDEPMVIESSRYESLSDEAEQVKKVYASNLAEELGAFDAEELMDKFSIEELRSKHDEHVGDLEEELSPDPKGSDPSEEELEENAESPDEEELERDEEVSKKQEELRSKILG